MTAARTRTGSPDPRESPAFHPSDPGGAMTGDIRPGTDERPPVGSDETAAHQPDARASIPEVGSAWQAPVSKKGLLAIVLLVISLVAVSAMAIHRLTSNWAQAGAVDRVPSSERPAAASIESRRLDLAAASPRLRASAVLTEPEQASEADTTQALAHKIPALVPNAEELAEPIGVRRTSTPPSSAGAAAGTRPAIPADAPVMLVSTRPSPVAPASGSQHTRDEPATGDHADPLAETTRSLQDYQRRLQALLGGISTTGALAVGPGDSPPSAASMAPFTPGEARSGPAPVASTPRTLASQLDRRSLILPKGSTFSCALKSRIVSAMSGLVGCLVQRNVYGDDGRVLLIERGSHLDGEYRITAVRPGTVRIPVLWTRVRTPNGVAVDLDSPAIGQLGDAGIEGHVDQRWTERIGAAMLLSLIDDSVKLIASHQSEASQGGTVVLSSTTSGTARLAEKVLDSTINIPPLIYQNQGGIVGIYVARDLDFSSVYELVPTTAAPARP